MMMVMIMMVTMMIIQVAVLDFAIMMADYEEIIIDGAVCSANLHRLLNQQRIEQVLMVVVEWGECGRLSAPLHPIIHQGG